MLDKPRIAEKQEREASQFALAILMPAELVKKWKRAYPLFDMADDEQLQKLAKDFQVPLGAAAIRWKQLHEQATKWRGPNNSRALKGKQV